MASRGPPHLEKWEAVALQLEGLEIGGDWPDAMGAAPAPDCLRIPVDFEIHIMLRSCSRTATLLEGCIDRVGRRGCRALLPEPARLVFPRRHLRGERGRHGTQEYWVSTIGVFVLLVFWQSYRKTAQFKDLCMLMCNMIANRCADPATCSTLVSQAPDEAILSRCDRQVSNGCCSCMAKLLQERPWDMPTASPQEQLVALLRVLNDARHCLACVGWLTKGILRHRGAHRPTRRAVGQPPPPQVRRHMGRGHHRGEAAAGRCAHEIPSGHGRRHSHFGRRTTTGRGDDCRCLAVGTGSLEPVEKHLHFGRLCVIAGRCQFQLGCSTHRPAGAGLPHPFALGSLPRSDNRRTTQGSPGV